MRRRTPFKAPSVLRPVDTLAAVPGTRSGYIQEKTNGRRVQIYPPSTLSTKNKVHSNDHTTPNKKRKTVDLREAGDSSASAISLDDSQMLNDSEDELALSSSKPPSQIRKGPVQEPLASSGSRQSPISILRSRNAASSNQTQRQDRDYSPVDEGDFTKDAARQRRADKDKMLGSSPAASKPSVPQRTSPYFRQSVHAVQGGTHALKQVRQKDPTPESPDAIQGGETNPQRRASPVAGTANESRSRSSLRGSSIGQGFNSTKAKLSDPRAKNTASEKSSFKLNDLLYHNFADASIYTIKVDVSTKEISLHTDSPIFPDEPLTHPRAIRQIAGIFYGADGSALVRLQFSGIGQDYMFLRFDSDKSACDFIMLLAEAVPGLKMTGRHGDWMEGAFNRFKATRSSSPRRAQINNIRAENILPARMQDSPSGHPITGEKRARLIDKLDAPSPASRQHTVISGADHKAASEHAEVAREKDRRHSSRDSTSPEAGHLNVLTRRMTRSQDELVRIQGRSQSESRNRALGPPWSKDLVYPQPGRRAAIVHFDDLARLDHDGFLNDNLILFFMRYLETHMEKNNPEVYKRMHFFNTYFYEALTKNPKAKKNLNYEAVSRWTKNINLFSRDFVVVPVNENLHWYVAIICNLPYFLGDKGDSGWPGSTIGIERPNEGGEDESEEEADAKTAATQNSLADLSISDGEKDGQIPAKRKRPGRRKVPRRSLPKYPINKPVIITLDSLGHSRSATCSHLRNYVALEAKDKRNLEIDPAELRGMTAKEIPTQGNFSDCGLFVCVYLEQFVADPYNFVRRILQRDESGQQWPREIHSEDLRSRLRELILEMHRRQEKESTKQDEPIIGNILIERETPSLTPPPNHEKPPTKQDIEEAQERFEALVGARGQPPNPREGCAVQPNPLAAARDSIDALHAVPDSQDRYVENDEDDIIISDEVLRVKTEHVPTSPPFREPRVKQSSPSAPAAQAKASPSSTHAHPMQKGRTHSNPAELAEHLREGRAEHNRHRRRQVTQKKKSPEKTRASRSPSRLTDELLSGEKSWLPGIESFAAQISASPGLATTREENARRATPENMSSSSSPSSSSEPEIVGERRVLPARQTPGSKKRKRASGKVEAPETAQDLPRCESGGFYDEAEAEVPESQDAQAGHGRSSWLNSGASKKYKICR
ncbi:hypothetical protein A1O7_04686 [Cladophialophora yegresii CBS 114405]|uniref:Ubiquitin-like protease family profile domain-containing protein n=1 Tax=Cladophialophora yegresii CBS 114405 TaxID=1182544 RepID=W9VXZ3_9EURO|nr:uncharacterized protein A1O7_04686 [Cladophialophora yegresii CBS 114405]EXJ60533.1 hypothetical protein A1O7_04686 [Cladophialophora yegresii CBS 114405]